MSLVKRYVRPLRLADLPNAFGASGMPDEELPGIAIELERVRLAISENLAAEERSTAIDVALVEPFHKAMSGLDRRVAADMRIWHWLCIEGFPEIVRRRWGIADSLGSGVQLKKADAAHFLGGSNLEGIARNSFSRLWWTAEQLEGDYDSARAVLSNAEDYVAIFERQYGIFRPAAMAAIPRFGAEGVPDDDQREAAKWLQQNISTTVLEALDQQRIGQILDESLEDRHRG